MKRKLILSLMVVSVLLCACGSKKGTKTVVLENGQKVKAKEVIREVAIDEIKDEVGKEYKYGPADITCIIPDGFKATELEGEYLYKNYPKDVSSINQVISEGEVNPTDQSQEEFEASMEKEYKEAYGDDVDIEISQYEKVVVDDRPGLWIMYNFEFREEKYEVLMVVLFNGTETNYITYLQGPGADWMEEFIESAMSIKFVAK